MTSNIDKLEEYFKNNLSYNTFELIFKNNDSNIMINYDDVKKILNCKKDILINLLISKKNNFNENIDYEISSAKNINLSINTIKHICLMKNNLYRDFHLNNENVLLLKNLTLFNFNNNKKFTLNNFFDDNSIDDYLNKQIYYIIKINDNLYSYGHTFTIQKTINDYKKLNNNINIYFIKCWDVKNIQISKKIDIDFKNYIIHNNIESFNNSYEYFKYNEDENKLVNDIELYINVNIKNFDQLYENK